MCTISYFRGNAHWLVLVEPSKVAGAVDGEACNPCGPVGFVPPLFAPAAAALALLDAAVEATCGLACVAGAAIGGGAGGAVGADGPPNIPIIFCPS
jgi:hypothetical protein